MLLIVAAGGLYALVCALLGDSLPEFVPVLFDRHLVASRIVERDEFVLLAAAVGTVVTALAAGAVALVRWYAPTGTTRQAELRRLVSGDLSRLGCLTLVFLSVELAVVYEPSTGAEAGSSTGADAPAASSAAADTSLAAIRAAAEGAHLPPAALVVLGGYLALLGWAGLRLPRRYRRPVPRTADSVA